MRKLFVTIMLSVVGTPAALSQTRPIDIDSFQLGESAAIIEQSLGKGDNELARRIEQMRHSNEVGSSDPTFGIGLARIIIPSGYQFTVGGLRILATCKADGMRIYAIQQQKQFTSVTAADVVPVLKRRFGAGAASVRIAPDRPGETYTRQWLLWNGAPAGVDSAMVNAWGHLDRSADSPLTLPSGLSAFVLGAGMRTDVTISRFSPEIAAHTPQCAAAMREGDHARAVGRVRF